MATNVEIRKCPKCETQYKTKVKRGKDTRPCPGCEPEVKPAPLVKMIAALAAPLRGASSCITVAPEYISGVGLAGQYAWCDDDVARYG